MGEPGFETPYFFNFNRRLLHPWTGGSVMIYPRRSEVRQRKIGHVIIIDLKGALTGVKSEETQAMIQRVLQLMQPQQLLFNLHMVEALDPRLAEFMLKQLTRRIDYAFIWAHQSIREILDRVAPRGGLKLFTGEEDTVQYFGRYLVEEVPGIFRERRKFPRMKTALPVGFSYADHLGHTLRFKAIVTDMSEGGLLLEYLDGGYEYDEAYWIDPYDFKTLHMELPFFGRDVMRVDGRVVRTVLNGKQLGLGIEFYEPDEKLHSEIRTFLQKRQ